MKRKFKLSKSIRKELKLKYGAGVTGLPLMFLMQAIMAFQILRRDRAILVGEQKELLKRYFSIRIAATCGILSFGIPLGFFLKWIEPEGIDFRGDFGFLVMLGIAAIMFLLCAIFFYIVFRLVAEIAAPKDMSQGSNTNA